MKNKESTIEELNKIMENLNLGKPSGMVSNRKTDNISKEDFTTRSGGVSDNHEDMWMLALKLHNKKQATPYWGTRQHTNNIHQVYVIISGTPEGYDGENNPVINSQNSKQGNNQRVEKEPAQLLQVGKRCTS
jgi:hypothetical protein